MSESAKNPLPGYVESLSGEWRVVQLMGGRELVFAGMLTRERIPFYLPTEALRVKRAGVADRFFDRPLFPGYAFLCGTFDEYCRARELSHILNMRLGLIRVADQQDLRTRLIRIEGMLGYDPHPLLHRGLIEGAKVRVKAPHPLMGHEGILLSWGKNHRLTIQLDIIQQSVSVEIDPDDVEPLE